ncbi:MAG TPA: hypothetical protein VFS60_01830 [Thermoanaerobaculia bacterium]|nr:hypothetical protein [Thermoanaerobaculia bacterium]
MNQHRPLLLVASLALAAGVLGACSPGASSPTEPTIAFDSAAKSFASSSTSTSTATATASAAGDDLLAKRHGGDDDGSADTSSADDNGGSGGGSNDDGTADQGRNGGGNGNGADDNNNQRRRGRRNRGGDDNPQQPRAPRGGQEFEATVQSVAGSTITLVTGTRVVVNGQTQWNTRGDLRTLQALANAVAANRAPRVEGRGARQADGSIVAQTIKAEIDN